MDKVLWLFFLGYIWLCNVVWIWDVDVVELKMMRVWVWIWLRKKVVMMLFGEVCEEVREVRWEWRLVGWRGCMRLLMYNVEVVGWCVGVILCLKFILLFFWIGDSVFDGLYILCFLFFDVLWGGWGVFDIILVFVFIIILFLGLVLLLVWVCFLVIFFLIGGGFWDCCLCFCEFGEGRFVGIFVLLGVWVVGDGVDVCVLGLDLVVEGLLVCIGLGVVLLEEVVWVFVVFWGVLGFGIFFVVLLILIGGCFDLLVVVFFILFCGFVLVVVVVLGCCFLVVVFLMLFFFCFFVFLFFLWVVLFVWRCLMSFVFRLLMFKFWCFSFVLRLIILSFV